MRDEQRRSGARRRTIRRWAFPAILGAAGMAILAVVAIGAPGEPSAPSIRAPRPVLGDAAAPVVIREFGDFQCPSCGAFARGIEPQIRAAYIETGLAKLEWHDFAWIGPESREAANAARCAAAQGEFWAYHDLLYERQGGENSGTFTPERLKAFALEVGLEPTAFGACVDARTYAEIVQADLGDVRSRGFSGTPTFTIGDQRIVGAQSFAVFRAAIEAALAGR